MCKQKLEKIEGPFRILQEGQTRLTHVAEKYQAESAAAKVQVDVLQGTIAPFQAQIKLCEDEIATLKATRKEQEEYNLALNKQLTETLAELKERSDKFYYSEKLLAERDEKIAKLKASLETTTRRMNLFETEKDRLTTRVQFAEGEIKDLRDRNDQMSIMIDLVDKHENNREQQLIAEKERNEKFQELLIQTENELKYSETTGMFLLQNTNRELELKISKMTLELDKRAKLQEDDRRFHKEDKIRMHRQVERLTEMNLKYQKEQKQNIQNESKYRFRNKKMQDETNQIKIKNKLLEEEVANFEKRKEEHRKEILELNN